MTASARKPPRFVLLAGEASGDILGASLIPALSARFPDAVFEGITGPLMRAAGCGSLANIDQLSVMGIAEVLPKLPAILRLRRELVARLLGDPPDCLIGIDAPDFTLAIERRLRAAGVRTVHVVSPTVWAWRAGRVQGIARACELILCLFPFEPRCYDGAGVRAAYIGHPLAEELATPPSRTAARAALGLDAQAPILAVLPGSRGGELKYLAEPFARTVAWLAERVPGLQIVTPVAKPGLAPMLDAAIAAHAPRTRWTRVAGRSREAMCAADAVLLASGTATLECLLLDRAMVIAYRASAFTAFLLGRLGMLKTLHVGLPNLLAAQPVVPELLQAHCRAEELGPALLELLTDAAARERQLAAFAPVRVELRRDAAAGAAAAIAELLATPR